ncbi:MAG: DbpA RNA binding domain-containing protein, partial [Clostridiales bacterium]|nr:DbpA RNA binding domain-containing protein [Clostridiales bacterium]
AKIKFMTIPNVAEITDVRIQQTMNGVLDVIAHSKLDVFAEAIQQFIEEADDEFTILDVAAAFLSREVGTEDLQEIESGFSRSDRGGNRRNNTNNPDATRIFINIGRLDHINKGHMEEMLVNCGVPSDKIFDIDIMEKFSFVEVDTAKVDDVLASLNGSMVNNRRVNAEISTPRRSSSRGGSSRSGNGGSRRDGGRSRRSDNGGRRSSRDSKRN